MNIKCNSRIIFFVFLTLFLTNCSPHNLPSIPNIGIPSSELNHDLAVYAPIALNSFKIGKSVGLFVRLKSDIEIETSSDFNARIFVLDNHQRDWKEISQLPDLGIPNVGIFAPQNVIMSLKADGVKDLGISLFPDLRNENSASCPISCFDGEYLSKWTVNQSRCGRICYSKFISVNISDQSSFFNSLLQSVW